MQLISKLSYNYITVLYSKNLVDDRKKIMNCEIFVLYFDHQWLASLYQMTPNIDFPDSLLFKSS